LTVTVPSNATTLDFVFTNGSSWDNNGGQDWQVAVERGATPIPTPTPTPTPTATPTPTPTPTPGPGDEWFYRGTTNSWGATPLTETAPNTWEITVTFNGEDPSPRFKIDRFGDWTENYPQQDVLTQDLSTYNIVFDSASKQVIANLVDGPDLIAPTVTADPAPGTYSTDRAVGLSVTDNEDPAPVVFYTTDGSQPTISSPLYTGQTIMATDIGQGTDLNIRTLAVDAEGNEREQSFRYFIGEVVTTTGDFREETIYFLMTTRFFDGDTENNYYSECDEQAGNPTSDPAWRGDFKGLVEKLDYIKALGFTAIWITPVVENRSCYDFHGYHGYDFTKIDPRLESDGYTFQRLIDEIHARDMKICLDIVLNHSGNFGAVGLQEAFGDDYLDRVQNQLFPTPYYHNDWLKNWEDYTAQVGSFADLVDFNTENAQTQQYLIDVYNRFIDMGVDSFRIDTVKHISRVMFNRHFVPAFKARGGEDFYMFGEVATRVHEIWNKNVAPLSTPFYTWQERQLFSQDDEVAALEGYNYENNIGVNNQPTSDNHYLWGNDYHAPDYSRSSGMAVIDFPMHWNFQNAWSAFNTRHGDHFYNDATWNVTYVDSHDYGPDSDTRYSGSQGDWAENMSLMWTFRGIPCLYYGSEIQFQAGARADCGPNCPLSTTGRAYFGDHIEGTVNVSDFGIVSSATGNVAQTLSHPLAQHLQSLNRIRRAIPALQKGQYSTDGVSGGLAYKRRFTKDGVDSFALVSISGGASFSGIPNGTYIDAVTGQTVNVTNNNLSTDLTGQGNMRVFVLDLPGNPAPGKIADGGPYLH
ncbi:MAG: alpha-amylase family glycosyl hydrolase, partial [Sumerlaeia bacterium]